MHSYLNVPVDFLQKAFKITPKERRWIQNEFKECGNIHFSRKCIFSKKNLLSGYFLTNIFHFRNNASYSKCKNVYRRILNGRSGGRNIHS